MLACRIKELLGDRPVMWLAAQTMITPGTIYNWMSGKTEPQVSDAFKVADAFGVDVRDVWAPSSEQAPIEPALPEAQAS